LTISNAVPFDPALLPSVFDIDIDAPVATPAPPRGFAALGVPRPLVHALSREGITEPFDIQSATLPDALQGRNVLGRGQTGSGKTLAFGLAVLARLAEGKPARPHNPRALILVPTRELAMQVADALRPLARATDLFLGTAVGGVPYDRQILGLQRGLELLVATPGRLRDLIERGACALDEIEITVLDEADQMADMGFLPEVTQLLEQTPATAQRLLFSATLDGDVDTLVQRFLTDPVTHSTAPAAASVTTMDHLLLLIPPQEKFKVAAAIANREGRTIMFVRTQMAVDRLVEQLREVGVRAAGLHGGKTQRVRTRTLAEFKEGRMGVLVATDVAARGIHIDGVSLVVHIDPPRDSKDYLHRAGRTARAGESGAVATLVLPKQRRTTLSMMQKAGVPAPGEHRVRMVDARLAELTGAREPSGRPVVDEPRREERPRSGGGFRGRREGGFAGRREGGSLNRHDSAREHGSSRPGEPGVENMAQRDGRRHRSFASRPRRTFRDNPQHTSGERPDRTD
jgi:superfamily II DNA/RNA helicase